ncbi:MAG TPA: DUF1616 domain-containing protein [bacterium]|nr:DUF1616 domain-containing protein [bacterium]
MDSVPNAVKRRSGRYMVYARRMVLAEGFVWLAMLIAAVFLYILPGWALLSILFPKWGSMSLGEKLGLSVGVSLAVYPLLFLWTDLIGLHLGPLYAWAPPTIASIYLIWNNRSRLNFSTIKRINFKTVHWSNPAYIAIIGLIFFVRFWSIRNLDAPMWGDSYQHTLITQLLVDNGGLFDSWKPYADLSTFTYHFGFHALAAVFHWVTRMALPQTVLWTGQILNGLAVICLYPLAMRIGRTRWAGFAAVLIAGLLSTTPMFYVNWGRYTQLAGQVVLSSVVLLAWETFESKTNKWRLIGLSWVALGGLALTHYRVLIFAVLFFAAFFLLYARKGSLRTLLARISWIGIGAGLLFLPRFVQVFAGKILDIAAFQITTSPTQASDFLRQYNAIGDIFIYLPVGLWLLMILAVGWGLWRREKGAVLISLWWGLALLSTNPQWFDLPGAGLISNFHLFIAVYFPAGVLIGGAIGWLVEILPTKYNTLREREIVASAFKPVWISVLLLLVVGIGLWGTRKRMGDLLVSQHALVTRPDLNAATWIRENISPEARFLVNSFFAYGDILIVGSDAGWWLPLLANRQTTLPPINYGNEQGFQPDYVVWVNALNVAILQNGLDHPDVQALLSERGVTHVYIGQLQGQVNYQGPALDPNLMLASPNFQPVYHRDRVWIFTVD